MILFINCYLVFHCVMFFGCFFFLTIMYVSDILSQVWVTELPPFIWERVANSACHLFLL